MRLRLHLSYRLINVGNLSEDEAGVPAGLRPELSAIGSPRINSMAITVATI